MPYFLVIIFSFSQPFLLALPLLIYWFNCIPFDLGEECDSSVIETMAQYGVNTSSLRCLSDSQGNIIPFNFLVKTNKTKYMTETDWIVKKTVHSGFVASVLLKRKLL